MDFRYENFLSTGLSVTRVGTRGYNDRQKDQNAKLLKSLAAYAQAEEFSHFGAELSDQSKSDITRGKWLREIFTQVPGETYTLMAQQLIMGIALDIPTNVELNVPVLKRQAIELAKNVKSDQDFEAARGQLQEQSTKAPPTTTPAAPAETPAPAPTGATSK
jgi:F0F1-type ATP synthase alpha subunit